MNCLLDHITECLAKYGLATGSGRDAEISLKGQYLTSLLTTLFCLVVYVSSHFVFSLVSKTYQNLKNKDKMFWNLAIVRGVYGFLGTVWAIWVICTCQIDNPASGTTRETRFVCISSFGFFMFETSAQIFFDIKFKTFSKALLLHHFIAITGYFMAVWFNVNHYVSVIAFILEASTPFSCVCYCLIKAGLESSMLWKVNQLVLIHVFHVRSVIECYMMYVMLSNWDKYAQIPPICFWHSFFSVLIVLVFLTPYWTYRKTAQFFEPVDWNSESQKKKTK